MAKLGYTLSSEEFGPNDLVRFAGLAEDAGFDFLSISDHFHPWVDEQGHSPFVWATLGGVAQTTKRVEVVTGVTCPTIRIHPAIIAHASATVAAMFEGRFSLGVGSGENLNEHVLGDRWPEPDVRQEMLEEAVTVIREMWEGSLYSHHGKHYTVERARLYTVPDEPPPIIVASAGENATELAGRIGDGIFGLVPDPSLVEQFEAAGGEGKSKYGQVHVCWAESEGEAKKTAHESWPNAAIGGNLSWELPIPSLFADAAENVSVDDVAESVVCGPDPEPFVEAIQEFIDAGYTHAYWHQIGPDQEGFIRFAEAELLPRLRT